MPYEPKPLSCDPSRLNGLSERLILSHWENNYGGAVKRLNAIEERLAGLDWANAPVFEINGLKREELIAAGLHDPARGLLRLLRRHRGASAGALRARIERDFGSLRRLARRSSPPWARPRAAAPAGPSWYGCPRRGRLVNAWAADHAHNLAGATPLIALDMYEHSYHLDFAAKAGAYVDAFMNNLSWTAAEAAFTQLGA